MTTGESTISNQSIDICGIGIMGESVGIFDRLHVDSLGLENGETRHQIS